MLGFKLNHVWKGVLVWSKADIDVTIIFGTLIEWQQRRKQTKKYIDGLVQERCNHSALAMELRISCINPSILSSVLNRYVNIGYWLLCQIRETVHHLHVTFHKTWLSICESHKKDIHTLTDKRLQKYNNGNETQRRCIQVQSPSHL